MSVCLSVCLSVWRISKKKLLLTDLNQILYNDKRSVKDQSILDSGTDPALNPGSIFPLFHHWEIDSSRHQIRTERVVNGWMFMYMDNERRWRKFELYECLLFFTRQRKAAVYRYSRRWRWTKTTIMHIKTNWRICASWESVLQKSTNCYDCVCFMLDTPLLIRA